MPDRFAMGLQTEILMLSFGYALLGLLLLLAVTRTRLAWPVKATAIAVTSAFYLVVFLRTEGLLGWSAPEPLPPRFQLLWARSVEPNLALDEPGALHLWVEELDEANVASAVPRAYRLPYSAALARKVESARAEIMNGRPQGGRAEQFGSGDGQPVPDGAPRRGVEAGGDPASGGALDSAFLGGEQQSVEFAPLPVVKLPPKDAPP
jgi:hypothetical protein